MIEELSLSQPREQGPNKLFAVEKLMRHNPMCVLPSTTVGEAIALMTYHDYSQLPITSNGANDGDFIGIISYKSIAQAYHKRLKQQMAPNVGSHLLEESVISYQEEEPEKLEPSDDVYKALEVLKGGFAIVVIENNKPRGIITDWDVSQFLFRTAQGMLKVEEIERRIESLIIGVYSQSYFDMKVKGKMYLPQKGRLLKKYQSDHNMNFRPSKVFDFVLQEVVDIRNSIVHFHDTFDGEDYNIMEEMLDWLHNPRDLDDDEAKNLQERAKQNKIRKRPKLIFAKRCHIAHFAD